MEKISEEKNSLKQTLYSVCCAFVGVQSNKNREQDFTHGKLSHFIIVGIIAVLAFIACLVVIVSLVIQSQ